jgi:hypothetical protein
MPEAGLKALNGDLANGEYGYPGGYTCHFPRPNWRLPTRARGVHGVTA